MDPLTIIQLAMQYGGQIKEIWDKSQTNEDVMTKVKSLAPPIVNLLEQVGTKMFPEAGPLLHSIGGIVAAFTPNDTKKLQQKLNAVLKPSPNLKPDGIYGNATKEAVKQFQTKMGLDVDGIAGKITMQALNSVGST